ncbi:MAG: hypothetical protein QM704_12995 [Anaeromyxobacteraceae bacterium]
MNAITNVEHLFDPTRPAPPEKLQAVPQDVPDARPAALKATIAAHVREASRAGRIATEQSVRALAPELSQQRLSELLAEMAGEGAYGDVKAVVAPSGRVYLFSETTLIAVEAQQKAGVEEAKIAIAEKIRADSRMLLLTPAAALEPLFPFEGEAQRAGLLEEVKADPRFKDLQAVTGPKGEVYWHSDAYISGNYGKIMMRSRTADFGWAIAEFVRDRSMIQPAPTRISVFKESVFGIDFRKIEDLVLELLAKPEYADVKKLVQRETGAVYLYSERHLTEQQATHLMDWEEVEKARNP